MKPRVMRGAVRRWMGRGRSRRSGRRKDIVGVEWSRWDWARGGDIAGGRWAAERGLFAGALIGGLVSREWEGRVTVVGASHSL